MSIDIFTAAKEKTMPQWAKFANAGDGVQGTYIGKITGQHDSYQNEQIIYQLLQDDGSVVNVAFGLNKKFINQDMDKVAFGQIIGFRYKGIVKVMDKRTGKEVSVKDYSLHQDPKIVNAVWVKENLNNMPTVTRVVAEEQSEASKAFDNINKTEIEASQLEDIPFSSESSLTNEDKLAVITKLSKDKLGANDLQTVKDKVMEVTGIAFIPVNYSKIIDVLSAM